MAATVCGTIRDLLEQTMATIDALLATPEGELAMPSTHVCAQGKDLWTLITNDIDHEKIHTGQVLPRGGQARARTRAGLAEDNDRGPGGASRQWVRFLADQAEQRGAEGDSPGRFAFIAS